ncbi:transposase [Chryseobacterium sp. MYb7]|jgi:hypothetical protein|uniref:transposase n=1 Tax=Chryseobacterium sp. MYb7 TaxID=1827290 RepID=UPI000CFF0171|nr:transposase [Chryseobacterium sp. MYb7]PRB01656.1 transposase [Chryseobacterium sp. MYb7]
MDFKDIHIGKLIQSRVNDLDINIERICNFLDINELEISEMYESKEINTSFLLRWSKLLEYDFFRIYSQHLILYSPPSNINKKNSKSRKSRLPDFRKHIYTREVIHFILELISSGKKTKLEIMNDYKIPKTTLYKWISKNSSNKLGS